MSDFRVGDIVRLIKPCKWLDNSDYWISTKQEFTISRVIAPKGDYPTGLAGPIAGVNLEPEYLELVHRPATREETEAMREIVECGERLREAKTDQEESVARTHLYNALDDLNNMFYVQLKGKVNGSTDYAGERG